MFAAVGLLSACSVYSVPNESQPQGSASGGSTSIGGTDAALPDGGEGALGGTPAGGTTSPASSGAGSLPGAGMDGGGGAPDNTSGGGAPDNTSGGGTAGTAGGGASGTAGSGGTSSTAGGTAGTAGSGGTSPGPTSYRYVKLLATSEMGGKVWSSVAELQVLTTGAKAIARQGWSITADSEEIVTEKAAATNAIDGDPATYWHTHWQWAPNDVNDTPLPHYLIIDMGKAAPISGFSYLPRQNSPNGRIKDWAFYVSNDGTSWGTPVKSGAFAAGATLQTISF
ncbi:MAG TPA: discoidin domain-containing protein [Polyangiaceae bacterium]|nr:discoidin domain-containing protein [Polyangiaceae bacterium]